jgi:hypothetical protein
MFAFGSLEDAEEDKREKSSLKINLIGYNAKNEGYNLRKYCEITYMKLDVIGL